MLALAGEAAAHRSLLDRAAAALLTSPGAGRWWEARAGVSDAVRDYLAGSLLRHLREAERGGEATDLVFRLEVCVCSCVACGGCLLPLRMRTTHPGSPTRSGCARRCGAAAPAASSAPSGRTRPGRGVARAEVQGPPLQLTPPSCASSSRCVPGASRAGDASFSPCAPLLPPQALKLSAAALRAPRALDVLPDQIAGRLISVLRGEGRAARPRIRALVEEALVWRDSVGPSFRLRPVCPSLLQAGGACERVLAGHAGPITCVVVLDE